MLYCIRYVFVVREYHYWFFMFPFDASYMGWHTKVQGMNFFLIFLYDVNS